MLKVNKLNAYYGESHILKDVSATVDQGQVVVMMGPNGHGKSTLLKSICGLVEKVSGEISYNGEDIIGSAAGKIVNLGVIYIAENRELFPYMTVKDNLKLGAYSKNARVNEKKNMEWVASLFPILMERQKQLASTMSGGEAKMLAIARALMARPKAILMDEPSIGLAPLVVREIFGVIQRLKENGNTIFLAEQNARMALKISDRAYVMDLGRISLQGDSSSLQESDAVKEMYLGA